MRPGKGSDKDPASRIGWRMAGMAGEVAAYVAAGLLMGWGVGALFDTEWGLPVGACVGIITGVWNLIRESLRLNRYLDEHEKKGKKS